MTVHVETRGVSKLRDSFEDVVDYSNTENHRRSKVSAVLSKKGLEGVNQEKDCYKEQSSEDHRNVEDYDGESECGSEYVSEL